jgi:deoxycytidine triphosphate deaminase
MLTGSQIRDLRLIADGHDDCYRGASYDLRLQSVLTNEGKIEEHYSLPAQGIIEVVSIEHIKLPRNISGFAMVKTSLCNEGVLALNIGIIDPGWEGPLSSFLVNFGKNERLLAKGDVFLRLTFQKLEQEAEKVPKAFIDDQSYLADRRRRVQGRFGNTFLNVSEVLQKLAKETFDTYRTQIFTYVSIAALGLAFLTFFLNFANIQTQRYLQTGDAASLLSSREAFEQIARDLKEQNKELSAKVDRLEHQVLAPSSTTPPPQEPVKK